MLPTKHSVRKVAKLFTAIVTRLHGLPRSIISDRDPLFVSKFWRELFELSGTKLHLPYCLPLLHCCLFSFIFSFSFPFNCCLFFLFFLLPLSSYVASFFLYFFLLLPPPPRLPSPLQRPPPPPFFFLLPPLRTTLFPLPLRCEPPFPLILHRDPFSPFQNSVTTPLCQYVYFLFVF